MAHVDRQLLQKFLYILAFLIPPSQSMNCRCMTKVMQARLTACAAVTMHSGMQPNLFEGPLKLMDRNLLRIGSRKEGSIGLLGGRLTTTRVFSKHLNRLGSDRHQTGFKELQISDIENGAPKIDIAVRQRQCF